MINDEDNPIRSIVNLMSIKNVAIARNNPVPSDCTTGTKNFGKSVRATKVMPDHEVKLNDLMEMGCWKTTLALGDYVGKCNTK